VLQDRRRALHARLVGAIAVLSPERMAEQVERLAQHAFRGELWEKAVTYLRHAGTKAIARSAYREAVACFEQALAALQHRPQTRETLEQAIDLRFDLRNSLFPLGEFERIVNCLRDAEGLARTLDDQRRLGQLSVHMCHNLWMTGHPTEALGFGQRALTIAESLEDVPLRVTGSLYLGAACLRTGDYRRAEELLLAVLRLLEGDLSRQRLGLAGFPAVMARFFLDWVYADRGAFEQGIDHGQQGIRLAERLDQPYSLAAMCSVLGHLHVARGELGQAVPLLERGVAVCRQWNLPFHLAQNTGILGYAHALSGRVAQGIPLLEEALIAIEAMGFGAFRAPFLLFLGEAYVHAQRLDDALASATRALTFAQERGQRGYEAWTLRLLAEIAIHGGPSGMAPAEAHYGAALALASQLGMRPVVAHCHLGLGRLCCRAGKRQEAQEHFTIAASMYREMGMTSWLAKAEAGE
jgi:tetratricopeptide (TPR) repeat protein